MHVKREKKWRIPTEQTRKSPKRPSVSEKPTEKPEFASECGKGPPLAASNGLEARGELLIHDDVIYHQEDWPPGPDGFP